MVEPLVNREHADVLILTAVKDEYDAVLQVSNGAVEGSSWVVKVGPLGLDVAWRTFVTAEGQELRVAVTRALEMGSAAAASTASALFMEYRPGCLAMCGVCAGRRGDAQLGDVLIADRLWDYDIGKIQVELAEDGSRVERFGADPISYNLPPQWRQRADSFQPKEGKDWLLTRPRTNLAQGEWILERLFFGEKIWEHPDRPVKCSNYADILPQLWAKGWLVPSKLELTDAGRQHIDALLLRFPGGLPEPTPFQVRVGPVGTGSRVVKDPNIFSRLAAGMRKVIGLEMEGAAIGAVAHLLGIPHLFMKGVMDHADTEKGDNFKAFAARASAECLLEFLRRHWGDLDYRPTGQTGGGGDAEDAGTGQASQANRVTASSLLGTAGTAIVEATRPSLETAQIQEGCCADDPPKVFMSSAGAAFSHPSPTSDFKIANLCWTVRREKRPFRVYIVEPKEYSVKHHTEVFQTVLTFFLGLAPQDQRKDIDDGPRAPRVEPFDLLTFPEAFLPISSFLDVVKVLKNQPIQGFGCVHVGLRPDKTEQSHLLSVDKLLELVRGLQGSNGVQSDDLEPFASWLRGQSSDRMFNVGCLFTIDTKGKFRICLHPKLVRSKFERSSFAEEYMEEANLLTLVTLQPENRQLSRIVIQPLLCSDALHLDTDRPGGRPLEAITAIGGQLDSSLPDHVDLVSVAACTPHQGTPLMMWHPEFRTSCVRMMDDACRRHNLACLLLSNFGTLPGPQRKQAGLSGAYLPVPCAEADPPTAIQYAAYGRPTDDREQDNRWISPIQKGWSSLGHTVTLSSDARREYAIATIMGFTIERLPRDASPTHHKPGVMKIVLFDAMWGGQKSPDNSLQVRQRS